MTDRIIAPLAWLAPETASGTPGAPRWMTEP